MRKARLIERQPSPDAAAAWCARQRAAGKSLGFVPTMGALHEGHLALVDRARAENDAVCVSVFVNPLQFDDPRDFERYPRDADGDATLLAGRGAAMVFGGTLGEFFPGSGGERSAVPGVDPGPAAEGLEGAFRRGHFEGVATIVQRLFELVGAERAYFGAKDFQQTLVVRDVARRRGAPEIVVCPTVREPSGLALSSRNARLSAAGRERALQLSRALFATRDAWSAGERRAAELEALLQGQLEARDPRSAEGLEPEYAAVRDPGAWSVGTPAGRLTSAVCLVAARVEGVRLIDNVLLGEPQPA